MLDGHAAWTTERWVFPTTSQPTRSQLAYTESAFAKTRPQSWRLLRGVYMPVALFFSVLLLDPVAHFHITSTTCRAASSGQRLHLRPTSLIPAPTSTPPPSLSDVCPHPHHPRRPRGGNAPAAQPDRSRPRWPSPSAGCGAPAAAARASSSAVTAAPLSLMAAGVSPVPSGSSRARRPRPVAGGAIAPATQRPRRGAGSSVWVVVGVPEPCPPPARVFPTGLCSERGPWRTPYTARGGQP